MNTLKQELELLTPDSREENIYEYFIEKIKNPDEWSDFDVLTKPLRNTQPENVRIPALLQNRYRVFFLRNEEGKNPVIKAFIALQVHNDIAKVFRFEVEEKYRGQKLSLKTTQSLIDIFKEDTQIQKLKIGKWPTDTSKPEKKAVELIQRLKNHNNGTYTVDPNTHTITR